MTPGARHRVVVVGGGFGGLQAVRKLRRAPVEVTLVDRQNYHLFQPLFYQVATGALSAAEIAPPLRAVLKRQANARVLLAEVKGFDLERRQVLLDRLPNGQGGERLEYDTLVVAAGSNYSYFGHDEWKASAPELKSLAGAVDIRSRILTAFEAAEVEQDDERRRSWLTFVVVGGGPTGVEMAGQLAELARDTLRHDFRSVDTRAARVLLVETVDRVLPSFPPSLSRKAERALEKLGVTPLLRHTVVDVRPDSVAIRAAEGTTEDVPAHTIIWAAGVTASPLATALGTAAGAQVDRAGRLAVTPELTVPGHPEVFAIGDMVTVRRRDGSSVQLPGVSPVAMQQGRYVARAIRKRLRDRGTRPFTYFNKGDLATIGRWKAVADLRGIRLSGLLAWLIWLVVHLYYLVGFQNRLLVVTRWTVSIVTRGRGARLISETRSGLGSATGETAGGRTDATEAGQLQAVFNSDAADLDGVPTTRKEHSMNGSETVIRVGDEPVTLVNVFDVDTSKQQELVDLLIEGTERVMQHRPGFVSVNVLASKDGSRVVNYAQWRSQEDVSATMADPEVQGFARKAAELAKATPNVYSVVSVHHA